MRVLVGSYCCENQEDGVIVNTNFVNSGGFDVILLKKENIAVDNIFFDVALSEKNVPKSYSKLNKEGYVEAGTILEYKDSLCKNIVSSNFGQNNSVMDRSAKYKSEIPARVERTYIKKSIKETNIKMHELRLQVDKSICTKGNYSISQKRKGVAIQQRGRTSRHSCQQYLVKHSHCTK